MAYKRYRYQNTAGFATSATTLITPVIDVREFERFSISIANCATANTLVHVLVEAAQDPADSAANTPPYWFAVNTSTYLYASSVGNTAIISTDKWDSTWGYIRVSARTQVSASSGFIVTTVAGHRKLTS